MAPVRVGTGTGKTGDAPSPARAPALTPRQRRTGPGSDPAAVPGRRAADRTTGPAADRTTGPVTGPVTGPATAPATGQATTGSTTGTGGRGFGVLLLALAAGLFLNAVLGPLVLDVVDYPISASMLNQLLGLELVTTLLVVPWAAGAGLLAMRGSPAAPFLAFGPSAYASYMLVQYVLGPEYPHYTLTAVFQVLLLTLAGGLTLWSWSATRTAPLPPLTERRQRVYGAVLLGMAGFVLLRYLPALGGAVAGTELTAEFADARTFYWSIFLLDLGVVVPGTALAAVALLRGRRVGHRALYCAVGWFALVPPSVAAMGAVMLLDDDPNASLPTTVMLAAAAAGFGWFAVRVFRPLLAEPVPPRRPRHRAGATAQR